MYIMWLEQIPPPTPVNVHFSLVFDLALFGGNPRQIFEQEKSPACNNVFKGWI